MFQRRLSKTIFKRKKVCGRDINKVYLMLKKEFIFTNVWIVRNDLMKNHYQIRKKITVT